MAGEKIRVKSPSGRIGRIPAENLERAVDNGWEVLDSAGGFEPPSVSGEPPRMPGVAGPMLQPEDIIPTAAAMGLGAASGLLGLVGAGVGGFAGHGIRNLIRAGKGLPTPENIPASFAESGKEAALQTAGRALSGAVPAIARMAGRGIAGVSGLLTGTRGSLRRTFGAGLKGGASQEALISTLRGSASEKQIANDALESLQKIRQARGKSYRKEMDALKSTTYRTKIDLKPMKIELDDLLDAYNIGRSPDGTLDVSRASLDDAAITDVSRMVKIVDDWGSQVGDDTVKGLDILKRKLDDFYSPSSEARAFVSGIRRSVKDSITAKFPKYGDITKKYQQATDVVHDISSELSLGPNSKAGTIVRKLQQSLRTNFDLRKEFVETLDKAGNKNLLEQIAGLELSENLPRGMMRPVAGLAGLSSFINPTSLIGLPFTSPRLAGEIALKAGQAGRFLSPLRGAVRPAVQAGIGLGRKLFPDEF